MRRPESLNDFDTRSTGELIKAITTDTTDLVRKEVQLAKQEILDAVADRAKATAAVAAAGLLGVFAFGFLALALADGLATMMPDWAARLVTAAVFLGLTGTTLIVSKMIQKRPVVPERTVQTIKEDVAWAKQQLKR